MNVDNSNNIQKTNPPHTLKFKTPEENKGRSIFLQDDNNIVEINDIKGNGSKDFMEKLKAFLQPAADAGQSWTQELIDGAEKINSDYYETITERPRMEQVEQALRDNNCPWGTTISPRGAKWLFEQGVIDKNGNYIINEINGTEIQESGTYTPTEKDIKNLEKVFGQTTFADTFNDHNQMLDAIKYAEDNGVDLSEVEALINFDTHSDVYLNGGTGHSIADWVNNCLAKHPNIKDFYWVITGNMVKDGELGNILNGSSPEESSPAQKNKTLHRSQPLFKNVDVIADLNSGESIQTYYINQQGLIRYASDKMSIEEMSEYNYFLDSNELINRGFREIKIHICTKENLPNFKDKKVITSLDMDYLSNSGVDTHTYYRDNKNAEELNNAFSDLIQTMAEKDIHPILHGNCYSDDFYLPSEDLKQATEFAEAIIEATPQKEDILTEYEHEH